MLNNGREDKDEVGTQGTEGVAGQEASATETDPWASAFAALAEKSVGAAAGGADEAGESGDDATPAAGTDGLPPVGDDAEVGSDDAGGPGSDTGGASEDDEFGDIGNVDERLSEYAQEIEDRAMQDTLDMFLNTVDEQNNKKVRQANGRLGASINDPDIYVVDPKTGSATFYNPDTGRPFSGDNPRAQAQEWVEAYNKELRAAFNSVAETRRSEIEQEMAPVIDLVKFTPTYKQLDPVRRRMLDALIEDYEVYDKDDNHIGYSIDLNQALARVNKQVEAVKSVQAPKEKTPPTGPAVDMPTSTSGASTVGKSVSSLDEALEALQDAQIAQLKTKK